MLATMIAMTHEGSYRGASSFTTGVKDDYCSPDRSISSFGQGLHSDLARVLCSYETENVLDLDLQKSQCYSD